MDRNINSEFGKIKIHKKVVRQVAEKAALNVKGVAAVGWGCYLPILKTILRFFDISGTRVKLEKEVRVIIPITVMWGENLIDVAYEVQKNIIHHLLNDLNIESVSVDVKVKRVEGGIK